MEETGKMIAVPFEFNNEGYCALVRIKNSEEGGEFHVTVMNGELERALYGHHVFIYNNGVLHARSVAENQQLSALQEKIGWAIIDHLSKNESESPISNGRI